MKTIGTFRECVDGMNTAMCAAISYLTYMLVSNGREISLTESDEDKPCYGYLMVNDGSKDVVVEKKIKKIGLDENNNVLIYFDDDYYPLVGLEVQSMQTTYNIVDWFNEL